MPSLDIMVFYLDLSYHNVCAPALIKTETEFRDTFNPPALPIQLQINGGQQVKTEFRDLLETNYFIQDQDFLDECPDPAFGV